MKPEFTQLEFMNELFTPCVPLFPFLNDMLQNHEGKGFHFVIGGMGGISIENIKIIDKKRQAVEDAIWEPVGVNGASKYLSDQIVKKGDGIYDLHSPKDIFISTKAAYRPYDYTVSLRINTVRDWFYFCISLSGAEDNCVVPNSKYQSQKAIMFIAPEKRSTRISFWNNNDRKEWVVSRTNFNWDSYHTFDIDKTENGEWVFILDGSPISDMGNVLKPHSHHCYELSYIQSGSGHMTIDGETHFLDTDSFILIKPNAIHSFQGNKSCRLMYIGFFYDNSYGILNRIFYGKATEISKIMMQLDQELKQVPNNYEDLAHEYQKLIIFTLLRMQHQLFPTDKNATVFHNIISEIKNNFTEPIDTKSLFDAAGYSYHHFRHIFKRSFGMTLNQYIMELRLQYAMQLLRNTNMSIKEISGKSGFKSAATLTDNMKKIYGLMPSDYQKAEESLLEVFSISKETVDS